MTALPLFLSFTSPRVRGEVGSLAIRVRGSFNAFTRILLAPIMAPHPNPLPARAGRGSASCLRSER
jgi:hypothetical protein